MFSFSAFLPGLLAVCAGSRIVLEHTPTRVAYSLTKTLILRCSLEDTTHPNATSWQLKDGQEVGTETLDNANGIASIAIMRDGEKIASLEENSLPTAEGDTANVRVFGDLTLPLSSGVERAFLELVWSSPGYNQSGEYVCYINATSSQDGERVTYAASAEIGVQFPSKQDLLERMKFLQTEDQANREKLGQLESAAALLVPAHSESGIFSCGDSGSWISDSSGSRFATKDVKFRRPYTGRPPVVSLGVKGVDADGRSNFRMRAIVTNVNTHGFRVRCGTWGNTHIYSMSVRWVSAVA